MKLFLSALILALTAESVFFALFPRAAKKSLQELGTQPESLLQKFGMGGLLLALVLAFLVHLIW